MWIKEQEFAVRLGGNTFINVPVIMAFKGEPLFQIFRSDGNYELAIDFEVFNSKGEKIATVKKNRIYPHHAHKAAFTIDGTENTLRLTDKSTGTILVEIKKGLAAQSGLDVSLNTYLPDGRLLSATPEGCSLPGIFFGNNTIQNCKVGISL